MRTITRTLLAALVGTTIVATNVTPAVAAIGAPLAATDLTTVAGAQHNTIVEPVTAAYGNTIVTTFQAGRYATQTSGAAAAGFATSLDGGATWTHGLLPNITVNSPTPNIYLRTVNMEVAHDTRHGRWIITNNVMSLSGTTWNYAALLVSTSTDGLTWSMPVHAAPNPNTLLVRPDKSWIACDNFATSAYYGRCYITYIANGLSKRFQMTYSDDGGQTWSAPVGTVNNAVGYDPVPVVKSNGDVVVVATMSNGTKMIAFRSTDGGATWTAPVTIATLQLHTLAAGLRTRSKPMVAIDAADRLYVSWYDCRFRAGCANNDIVIATSDDAITWNAPMRVSVDAVTSTVEHFVAAIGVTPGTSGATAQIYVVFYQMANAACVASTCQIFAVTASSNDGGATWTPTTNLHTKAMKPYMLANTTLGRMLADYHTIAFSNGVPVAGVVIAKASTTTVVNGVSVTNFNQHLYGARLA